MTKKTVQQIFVSYSNKDSDFKERLTDSLVKYNFDFWVASKSIEPGRPWRDQIHKGLAECQVMLLIVSPESMASQEVSREWHYFLDSNKDIIPILWKPAEMNYAIHDLHYINFHDRDYDLAFEELKQALDKEGIRPRAQKTPANVEINKDKTGNLFWLCHDMMELIRWLLTPAIPKEWIDVGFRQSLHHGRELGLKREIVDKLQQLVETTQVYQNHDWTNERREQFAAEVRIVFNVIAQEAQHADPNFNPGPG